MLAPSPVVKTTAKEALAKRFLTSVVVCCVLIFIYLASGLVASLVSVFANFIGYVISLAALFLLVISPLVLGVLYYFRRLIWGGADSVLVVFKYFSSVKEYKRALHFSFLIFIRLILTSLIAFSPNILIWFLSNPAVYEKFGFSLPEWATNLWTINGIIIIIATAVIVFVMLKYYLSPFIFVSNDEIDPAEAVNMSTIISKRTGADFFGLAMSFFGWILLSLLVLPLVFTMPYFVASYSVHCRFAITAYNLDADKFNNLNTPSYSTDQL